jgi:hypothetical protein
MKEDVELFPHHCPTLLLYNIVHIYLYKECMYKTCDKGGV